MDMPFTPSAADPFAGQNEPGTFWRILDDRLTAEDWTEAVRASMHALAGVPAAEGGGDPRCVINDILTESQFGPEHWCLSRSKRLYYGVVRSLLPAPARAALRTILMGRKRDGFPLRWPIEDRYVRFQYELVARLMAAKGLASVDYVQFWPAGKRYAFVLTHDIETGGGQRFAPPVADHDERYGFRSSFNFVPEKYRVDRGLIDELERRGFEVGVHGLVHDGRSFCSREVFDVRVQRINTYLAQWNAVGFRSPMTHRNPEWMQALDIEYDLSFFDTDPYEPMPGGTMSIWPFMMGRFVELPYTLCQDHTLTVTLGKRTPRVWLEKADFIRRYRGMALLNAHPDYLREPASRTIYEEFLRTMSERGDFWHALPRETARWWRARSGIGARGGAPAATDASGRPFEGVSGTIRFSGDEGIAL